MDEEIGLTMLKLGMVVITVTEKTKYGLLREDPWYSSTGYM